MSKASSAAVSIVLRTEVNLNEDDLNEQAKKQFGDHVNILHAYQLNARVILANNRLSPVGRHLYCLTLEKNYAICKSVLNYVANHPELNITTSQIRPPLILCGLPRTGTTLLYNLLACDPSCRAPLLMDMMDPVPPVARADTSRQVQRNTDAGRYSDMLKALGLLDYQREVVASHPHLAHDEDLAILSQAGLNWPTYLLAPGRENEFAMWFLDNTNKDFVYMKVVDLGIAHKEIARYNNQPTALGTQFYSAPECFTNQYAVTSKADIWSAGAILYFLTYGYPPTHGSAQPPANLLQTRSPLVHQILNYSLQRDPRLRPTHQWLAEHPFTKTSALY